MQRLGLDDAAGRTGEVPVELLFHTAQNTHPKASLVLIVAKKG